MRLGQPTQALNHGMIEIGDQVILECDLNQIPILEIRPFWFTKFRASFKNIIGAEIHICANTHPSMRCAISCFTSRTPPIQVFTFGGWQPYGPEENRALLIDRQAKSFMD